jgi:hypothetical protein
MAKPLGTGRGKLKPPASKLLRSEFSFDNVGLIMTKSIKSAKREPTDDDIRIALEKSKWGKTFTTDFLNKADMNTRITYLRLHGYFEMLEGVGDIFMAASETVDYSDLGGFVKVSLLDRAFGNYFAFVRLSTSGQLTESYVLLRACIESALYAFNIHNNPELVKIWLNRHKNAQSKKDSQNLFKPGVILSNLIQTNQSLGKNIKSDYEWCIDFGAHPNERAVIQNLKVTGRKMSFSLLNTTEGVFQGCLSMCATCGVNTLKLFNLIYPDDFKKFNAEERIQAIQEQMKRIAPEISYKLRSKSP